MLTGITGSLVSSASLESALAPVLDREGTTEDRRRGRRLHAWWRRAHARIGPASSPRAILDVGALPLLERLDYQVLHLEPLHAGFIGVIGHDHTPLVVIRTTTWGAAADNAWRDVVRAGRFAGTDWGLVYTGSHLRLVHATRAWSRRHLDADLAVALADARSAQAVSWLFGIDAVTGGEAPSRLQALLHHSERRGVTVRASLGRGVLDALDGLVAALGASGATRQQPDAPASFDAALIIVYRLLFLLFAEAHAMVPTWHPIYRDAYTIDRLCRRAQTTRSAVGIWEALQAISRLAHAGCRAGDLTVTAFNGRLFAPWHAPAAARAVVPDPVIARALLAVATTHTGHARERVRFEDLDVEQLGAVYERVLEYEPAHSRGGLTLARTSTTRKATGSFYTPRSMTEFLVRRTLHPLVDGRTPDEILALRVVDPAMGSGAFLVAATRYLTAALERAEHECGDWPKSGRPDGHRAELARLVAQRCVYGVDLNPMAVQLARLSLWLATLARDRPLTFLDHHLATGDSLMGAWLHDVVGRAPVRHTRRRGREWTPSLFDAGPAEHLAAWVVPERLRLAEDPGDSLDAVRRKERALDALTAADAPLARWKAAADFWCAAWCGDEPPVTAGLYADVVAWLTGRATALQARQIAAVAERGARTAREQRFFHWELEFPEVFLGPTGHRRMGAGFDAVLGNPPWDVLRADAGDAADRRASRRSSVAARRFFRDAGLYRLQGSGHANRYQQFVERALHLLRPGGRLGLILPSGFATDTGSGPLRRAVFDEVTIDRCLGFDNRRGIFPIHRDVRFLLVTGTHGGSTDQLTGAFGWDSPERLDQLPDHVRDDPPAARSVALSRTVLAAWDPDGLSVPLIADPADLDLLAHARGAAAPLADPSGWNVRFGRELNASDDKPHFVRRPSPPATDRWLPIIEGKHIEPFRVRAAMSRLVIARDTAATLIEPARSFERHRVAYRDVASATNRLTLIAAILAPGCLSTHTLFCLKSPLARADQYALVGLLNSLPVNYLVRLHVTTHVTTAVMARLPVPRPAPASPAHRLLATLAKRLERQALNDVDSYARLNALVAHLYRLSSAQYAHIVSTFPLLPAALRERCLLEYERATEAPSHREEGRG